MKGELERIRTVSWPNLGSNVALFASETEENYEKSQEG